MEKWMFQPLTGRFDGNRGRGLGDAGQSAGRLS
jgi:hypothetical protein